MAVVMFLITVGIVWGGLALSITHAVKKARN